MKLLLIDNDDSFTGNLDHLLTRTTGSQPMVVPYSRLGTIDPSEFDIAVISAGPGKPSEYPDYSTLIESGTPVLGVCLGMQIINEAFGGTTAPLPDCIHGKTDEIEFQDRTFTVARYHSLSVNDLGQDLDVIVINRSGLPMALQHRSLPILGYQFHPESFMTTNGGYFIEYAVSFFDKDRPEQVHGDRSIARPTQ